MADAPMRWASDVIVDLLHGYDLPYEIGRASCRERVYGLV